MEVGNRLLMGLLFLVIVAGLACAFALEWHGKQNSAMFLGIATTALGVLCPSPFQKPHPSASQSVEAPNADTVNITQPQVPPATEPPAVAVPIETPEERVAP